MKFADKLIFVNRLRITQFLHESCSHLCYLTSGNSVGASGSKVVLLGGKMEPEHSETVALVLGESVLLPGTTMATIAMVRFTRSM
jgi:hypothetical protein